MARLFPFRSETAAEEGQPRIVDLEGEDADAVFAALSSTTARRLYAHLDDEPGTPSDIADAIDSSIQNVRYHLENLEDAGLVEVVDTWYSSRGNEMSVYATTDGPLIVTSDESRASQVKEALSRFVGGVGALAGGSLLVQYGLTRWFDRTGSAISNDESQRSNGGGMADDGSGGGPTDAGETVDDGSSGGSTDADDGYGINNIDETNDSGSEVADGGTGATDSGLDAGGDGVQNASENGAEAADAVFGTVPPGVLFFLGGLTVLIAVTVYWYWYRPAY